MTAIEPVVRQQLALALAEPNLEVATLGRRAAKMAVWSMLPRSWLVWRGPVHAGPRRIALTFDDGPNELSGDYLDLLDSFGAKATFFLVGAWCARYPALVEEMTRRGHEVAGHGYTHRPFTVLGNKALQAELQRTEALFPPGKKGRRLVRPPRGSISARSLMVCAHMGFTTVLWSRDSADWRVSDADRISSAFARDDLMTGEIVLFHEGQRWTMEALPRVLHALQQSECQLVTVSELLDE